MLRGLCLAPHDEARWNTRGGNFTLEVLQCASYDVRFCWQARAALLVDLRPGRLDDILYMRKNSVWPEAGYLRWSRCRPKLQEERAVRVK